MGLFNKKKEEDKVAEEIAEVTVEKESPKKSVKKSKPVLQGDGQLAYEFIVRPWVTEKSQILMGENKYVFKLRQGATKKEAKLSVEKLYNVRVTDVNIVNIPQKKRRFGKVMGKKSALKKAIVTLKKGDKIEVFE